jgi:hypothetical protein
VLLAHTHSPYAWQADVDTTVVIPVLSLLYLFAVGRFGAPRERIACFAGAMVLLAVAFWTPLHHLGLHYLLLAHLLQNVILAEWAPLLAVLGISRPMAERLARFRTWRALTQPAVALPLWLGNYFAWHVPPVYDYALRHQSCPAGSPRDAVPPTRSRRSCSQRRSACCSRSCRSRRTGSTSTHRACGACRRSPTSRSPA